MNLLEIKKIGRLERLDLARELLNGVSSLDDVVNIVNKEPLRFRATIVAVYVFDALKTTGFDCLTDDKQVAHAVIFIVTKLRKHGAIRLVPTDVSRKVSTLVKYYIDTKVNDVAHALAQED